MYGTRSYHLVRLETKYGRYVQSCATLNQILSLLNALHAEYIHAVLIVYGVDTIMNSEFLMNSEFSLVDISNTIISINTAAGARGH